MMILIIIVIVFDFHVKNIYYVNGTDMGSELNQNIGNARFAGNHILEEYQKIYRLFKHHGYKRLKCNMTTFNTMLTMLKKEYLFFI